MKRLSTFFNFNLSVAGLMIALAIVAATNVTDAATQRTYPAPTGYINDTANVLSAEEKQNLEKSLSAFEKETSNEIAILTVPTTGNETIEEYSIHVTDQWKVGKKGRDNGILFTVAVNDHKMRLEIGRGLEGIIPDITAKTILDTYARPKFKQNDFAGGIGDVLEPLTKAAKQEFSVPEKSEEEVSPKGEASVLMKMRQERIKMYILITLLFLVVFFGAFSHYMAKTKSWWLGGALGSGFAIFFSLVSEVGINWLITMTIFAGGSGLLIDYLLSRNYKKHGKKNFWGRYWISGKSSNSSSSSFRGSGGSGGSSFGGFGGGSFSGGGGSSSW